MKSLDEYKLIVKKLKLRLRELQREKADLQQLSKLTPKQTVDFEAVREGARRAGLSMEMLFRAADTYCMEIVTHAQLQNVLFRVARLNEATIAEILRLFDMESSGSISRTEYQQSLEIYGLNSEESTNYLANCFAKYVHLTTSQNLSGRIGFIKMDPQKRGYIEEPVFVTFTSSLNNYEKIMKKRDVVGAFHYLDSKRLGWVTEVEYVRSYEKFAQLKKVVLDDPVVARLDQLRKVLLVKGIQLSDFILGLMESISRPEIGILYDDFEVYASKLIGKSDSLRLYAIIDSTQSGSIDYDELMYFYFLTKKRSDRFDILFVILARKLQAMQMPIERYLRLEQIYENTQLTFEQFQPIANDLFNCQEPYQQYELFCALDLDNSKTVSAKEIISFTNRAIGNLMPELLPYSEEPTTNKFSEEASQSQLQPDIMKSSRAMSASMMKKSENLLSTRQARPEGKQMDFETETIDQEQFFKRGTSSYWRTILNSQEACMKICTQLAEKTPRRWIDPEFGPIPEDPKGAFSIYISENNKIPGWPSSEDLEWSHVDDLADNWKYFQGGASANDVMQSSYLGDCWLISALSIVAQDDRYLQEIIPKNFRKFNEKGIYVLKINKLHTWRYIILDGRFCVYNSQLMFGKCRSEQEWWVQFIEKAYAKLHHCYEGLVAGDIAQGLQDLTGLPGSKVKINEETIKKCQLHGSLMGCSSSEEGYLKLNEERTGIVGGHAYGILRYFEIKTVQGQEQLLMVRNPWGFGEWELNWSDESDVLVENLATIEKYFQEEIARCTEMKVEPPEPYAPGKDGIFLMSYHDFSQVFNNLFVCYNIKQWHCLECDLNLPMGGLPSKSPTQMQHFALVNPQIMMEIVQPQGKKKDGKSKKSQQEAEPERHLFIQMSQTDGRLVRGQKYPFEEMKQVLLCVFRMEVEEERLDSFREDRLLASSKVISRRRDVDTGIFRVGTGKYLLIPSSREEQEVRLRIYMNFDPDLMEISGQVQMRRIKMGFT